MLKRLFIASAAGLLSLSAYGKVHYTSPIHSSEPQVQPNEKEIQDEIDRATDLIKQLISEQQCNIAPIDPEIERLIHIKNLLPIGSLDRPVLSEVINDLTLTRAKCQVDSLK